MKNPPRFLILGLGNDLAGDDGVGLCIARHAGEFVDPALVEVIESAEAGFTLMEHLSGRDAAVIVDSIQSGQVPVGTVSVLDRSQFRRVSAPSAHYSGLPEIFDLAERLMLPMPQHLAVIVVETEIPTRFRMGLSPEIEAAIKPATDKVLALIKAVSTSLIKA
ncbi:MAG: hydrogenase maturation protease [Armatimonadetes bacterium]|nr:hydrogenase maturation protease [Armatimonadota bacterium]